MVATMQAIIGMEIWHEAYTTIKAIKPYLVNSKGEPDQHEGTILLGLPKDMTPEQVQISIEILHGEDMPCPILALPYFWIPTRRQKDIILSEGRSPGDSFQLVAEAVLKWCSENHRVVIPENDFDQIVGSIQTK